MNGGTRSRAGDHVRSVIPGRQRWDIATLRGRAGVAKLLEARLGEQPGIGPVRANPVTGRLLVVHDGLLSSEEVSSLVLGAVALVRRGTAAPAPTASPDLGVRPARLGHRRDLARSVAVAGGGATVVVLASALRASPLVRVGAVVMAAAVVVVGAWRTSPRSRLASPGSRGSPRHPVLAMVGSRRRQFYLASALSMVGQVLYMAPVLGVAWMFLVVNTGSSASLVRLGLVGASSQLWFLAGATALVCALNATVLHLAQVQWQDLADQAQHEWRTETYAHVQHAELRYLDGERTTRLAMVLTDDIDQFGRFLGSSAGYLLRIATGLAVLVPVFVLIAPGMAWVALLPVPVIAWLSFRYRRHAGPEVVIRSESASALNSQLVNNLEASVTIKSFGAEEYEIDRIKGLSEACRSSSRRIGERTSAFAQTVQACAVASLAGTLLSGGLAVVGGGLSFGVFNALVGLPPVVLFQLPGLGDAVDQYQRAVAAIGRVADLRDLPVESGGTGLALDVATLHGEMSLEDVHFAYPGRPPVLQHVSLRIAGKRSTGIVGVTGAGKTTIAKLLLRLQDVDSGRVLLDGMDVREVRLRDLRSAIAFVGQDAFLFDGTVGDNIRYGTFDADHDSIEWAARLAEADGFIDALPLGYDTMVGERGVTLSGGQRQRISLARAILKRAPVLVLDEATSAVDNETEAAIQHALGEFSRNRTLAIIAHRLSTIRHAHWIYVLGGSGGVAEEGTHQQLLELDGVYAALWRLQVGEATP